MLSEPRPSSTTVPSTSTLAMSPARGAAEGGGRGSTTNTGLVPLLVLHTLQGRPGMDCSGGATPGAPAAEERGERQPVGTDMHERRGGQGDHPGIEEPVHQVL